jgi:hypothetical protein
MLSTMQESFQTQTQLEKNGKMHLRSIPWGEMSLIVKRNVNTGSSLICESNKIQIAKTSTILENDHTN